MRIRSLLLALLSACSLACAAKPSFEKDIVVVDFNDESEAALGQKWGRAYLAAITEKLFEAKVRAVVIKVFMDTPGNEAADARLAQAMKGGRTILQASINTEPPVGSELLSRFEYSGSVKDVHAQISGNVGWMPIAPFQAVAAKVCFADAQDVAIAPVLEQLGERLYKSLYACILEELVGSELAAVGPKFASVGPWQLPVTPGAGVAIHLDEPPFPNYITAQEVLRSNPAQTLLAGKVAIVTFSGSKSPTIVVAGSSMKIHQAFLAVLRGFLAQAQPVDASR